MKTRNKLIGGTLGGTALALSASWLITLIAPYVQHPTQRTSYSENGHLVYEVIVKEMGDLPVTNWYTRRGRITDRDPRGQN
jgi:hypothetical protein